MNKVVSIVVAMLVTSLLGLAGFAVIDGNNNATKFEEYDFHSIIEPSKDNGNIGEHIKGSAKAPVIIFEYADFQCPGCAGVNARLDKIIKANEGKIAIVYRNYILPGHQNGTAAASAAESAGIQGYWEAYAKILFSNQAEWFYTSGSERTDYFKKYFIMATGEQGNMDKFLKDMSSKEVSKKISFDMGIGQRISINGTPAFYIDGQLIDWSNKKGSSITINNQTITWDSARGMEMDFIKLFEDIITAKLTNK